MARATILHMFTAAPNLSPFDVNMAIDAGWQHCLPYTGLVPEQIAELTQDAIFSRGPKGVKRTGAFIGGRDAHVAMDMLEAARAAMVPPFEISVFADPSGAFTTAAGMVACVEQKYRSSTGEALDGCTALVFGGTGPVGMTCAMMASRAGARAVIVSHSSADRAKAVADECERRYGVSLESAGGDSDDAIEGLIGQADIVFNAAKAGVQILTPRHLAKAKRARVLCDANAVPPEGIAGVGVTDDGVAVATTPRAALGIGALAVGNVKYKTQQGLLQRMLESDRPVYLHYEHALDMARSLV